VSTKISSVNKRIYNIVILFPVIRDKNHLVIRSPRNKISPETLSIVKVSKVKSMAYATFSARLKSFKNWPKSLAQKPTILAEAGFYYTGVGDRVCCFYCGLGLKDWQEKDDPWKEHVVWNTTCNFTLMVKGNQIVQKMQTKE
jgi:baculoviral IAP repeat-containing protein 7/8